VYNGGSNSPQWEKSTTDLLGRTVSTEKPGFTGTEITTNYYDATGRLVKTSTPGMANTLYEYDEMGNQVRSGLDVNGNGALDSAATDRINESSTAYVTNGGSLWQKTEQRVYAAAAATTVSTQLSRLTGLGAGGLAAENISIDINGNRTISRATINRLTQTEQRSTKYPDSTIDEQQVSVAGLVTSATSKTGVTTTFAYDAFGRRISATDPRTGTATTQYDDKGRVASVTDAAGKTTTYQYDDTTGRKKAEINADGKYTRYAYNTQGQVTATWGDAAYPVSYEYDAYGRLSAMKTYREGQGWSGETFPTGSAGDATTWTYQAATGLLTSKTDAAGKAVSYTYGTAGRLATRTWARGGGTTYSYDSKTGELLKIDYADTTPDVTFTYDRLGRQNKVVDAVGTRTFTYGSNLQLATEVITGTTSGTITRTYDALGRAGGFSLGTDYSATYGYDDATGRFNTVGWTAAGKSGTVSYSYLANSDLLSSLTSGLGSQTSYSYEPNRNLHTQIKNEFGGSVISNYQYNYDNLGRRDRVDTTGQAFVGTPHNSYGYNPRSELEESKRFLGTTDDPAQLVNAEYRKYLYGPIGNRTSATEGASTGAKQLTYTANLLNQYTLIASPVEASPGYDADGNLTAAPAGIAGAVDTLLKYDAENRLISVEPQAPAAGSTKVEFVYDYMSRRTAKKVSAYAGGAWSLQSTSTFIYDGWNLICERNTAATTPVYYTWGLDLSGTLQGAGGIGGLLARVKDGAAQQYTFDGNGNVAQLISSTGDIVAQYEYDPYGNGIVATGDNPFRFSTKFFDDETGLLYYGYRFYSPVLGRWLNRDPLGQQGGLNLYGFATNSPLNQGDYLGLAKLWTFSGVNSLNLKNFKIEDYVNMYFQGRGMTVNKSFPSQSGILPFPYLVWNGKFVLTPLSEWQLNREADARIRDAQNEQDSSECQKGGLCCKNIKMLMVAPKTHTYLPQKSCCKISTEVYWSPYDPVPNQGLFHIETEQFWQQYGNVHTVDNNGIAVGAHKFENYMKDNPIIENKTVTVRGEAFEEIEESRWLENGSAPNPLSYVKQWMSDGQTDYVFVCHSQGCNIAMRLLNQVCTNK